MVAMVRCHYSPSMTLLGLHSHIGSQIFDTGGFEVAARRTMKLLAQFAEATGVQLPELNLGGGFGIAYTSADTPATPDELSRNLRDITVQESRAHQPLRSTGLPFSVAERIESAATSMKVLAPGSAQRNLTSVTERNVRPPAGCPAGDRSRLMSYAMMSRRRDRSAA